jgi:hypothetical protein
MKAPNKYGALLHAPSQTETNHTYHVDCSGQTKVVTVDEKQLLLASPLSSPILANKKRFRPEQVRKEGPSRGSLQHIRKEFRRSGFKYRQIAREGAWAIYEQKWRTSDNVAYEVVRIRPGSGLLAGRELYASSEKWGTDGFTLSDRDTAFKKLKQMSPEGRANQTGTDPEAYWNRNKHKLKPKTE